MALRLDMTVSLDGFVAGPRDTVDDPMGLGGFRLFDRLDRRDEPGPSGEVYAESLRTPTSAPVRCGEARGPHRP